jgi:alpha,alpha-trehalase
MPLSAASLELIVSDDDTPPITISPDDFDAVLFDLDGVVTKTAKVHAAAWKELFDTFLKRRAEGDGGNLRPFSGEDYQRYVDGKPRYDGVASFLASRGIDLPRGAPEDPPDAVTVCGLGNHKNQLFLKRLHEDGVEAYPGAVELLHALRRVGIRAAVVSSSANCREVVEAAGLAELFDTRVDGVVSAELELEGKPAPDIFAEAARRLGTQPARAVVVEDAVSGVQAGHRGHFGLVVGVDRTGHAEELVEGGADAVVRDLGKVKVAPAAGDAPALPSALEALDGIVERAEARGIAVFLDYDGTLTPIVATPEEATMPPEVRETVASLARRCHVAIISGRDRPDVAGMVGLDSLFYAGSHGFDIAGPDGTRFEVPEARALLPELDAAEEELREALAGIDGSRLERKRFAVTVHFRQVGEDDVPRVEEAVRKVHDRHPKLRASAGKKVHELRPGIDWDKGKALLKLMEVFGVREATPVYIGDDTTDEDAFRAIAGRGVPILVAAEPRESAAAYRLRDPDEVQRFLATLAGRLDDEERGRWVLAYDGFDPDQEALREALCTLGNGYFATRGAGSESSADGVHYPGTYLAGGYDRLTSHIAGRDVENEDLVNLPNWLPLSVRPAGGAWFDLGTVEVLQDRQELDVRRGVLRRRVRFRDDEGRETSLDERRIVHMGHAHLAAIELTVTAENWSGSLEIRSALDGRVINAGVKRYSDLDQRHLVPLDTRVLGGDTITLKVATVQSEFRIAEAARTRLSSGGRRVAARWRATEEPGYVAQTFTVDVTPGQAVTVEKIVSLFTSRDRAVSEAELEAREAVGRVPGFGELLASHELSWKHLWDRFDVEFTAPPEHGGQRTNLILHLYLFHLLQTTSIHVMTMALDVGVPSRGWHGEAYRGHIFWDELFIFPILNFRLPEITRTLLLYRFRRLEMARINAREAGFEGAMFPWQSGSDGREESQRLHLNPQSGNWIPDNSRLQRHVNAAISYNVHQYYQVTTDMEFMSFYGAEMVLEIARFWASIATYNEERERWEILGVMGPDEYHDAHPGADRPGLDNNAYTNVMAAWCLRWALEVLELLPGDRREQLRDHLRLRDEEVEAWRRISRRMFVPFHGDGIISQFEGYEQLEEFDWDGYREKYGDIQRLDRVLESEDDTPNRYKASKQADVLMLFYLFSAEKLVELFSSLGYEFSPGEIPRNIEYYLDRTSHGSTLSRVVHSWVLARSDRETSWKLFREALESDVSDIQGGTTPEGIHLGAMAGVADIIKRCYTGLEARGDLLSFNTALPRELDSLAMQIRYRGHTLDLTLTNRALRLVARPSSEKPIQVEVNGERFELSAGETREVPLDAEGAQG